jgi:2-methylcitrate dehydratase PrpD
LAQADHLAPYRVAFLDWLACACAGVDERAPAAVRASGEDLLSDVAFAGTAGHVLDFDDTFSDGVAHVSAATAPAALVVAAHLGRSLREVIDAYADGFEAMAAVAAASHPALYDAGWHPTAVCGPIGSAVATSRLLDLSSAERENAVAAALLRAGGMRGAFGSDGKSIQVGLAAAAGVQAALVARGGAVIDARAIHGPVGFQGVMGAGWPNDGLLSVRAGHGERAIDRNWIKLYPSCLGTHSPIEAAQLAREQGVRADRLEVLVDPVGRQAAHLDDVADGLSAKFSIPYCVARTLSNGPPRVRDFDGVDATTREEARLVRVTVDSSLPQFGAVLIAGEHEVARVDGPNGSPEHPVAAAALEGKIADLAGERLHGVFDDLDVPAATIVQTAGLRCSPGASVAAIAG